MVKEKDRIGYGIFGLVIGIVAIIMIVMDWYFMHWLFFYLLLYLPMAGGCIILGLMSYWGGNRDKIVGLISCLFGFLIIPLGLVFGIF
jgi:hypothetical protein